MQGDTAVPSSPSSSLVTSAGEILLCEVTVRFICVCSNMSIVIEKVTGGDFVRRQQMSFAVLGTSFSNVSGFAFLTGAYVCSA